MKTAALTVFALSGIAGLALFARDAHADNFGRVRYDRQADRLIVTMIYRGTHEVMDHVQGDNSSPALAIPTAG